MWSPKIPPPLFSNKRLNTIKKYMVWTFLCSKIALLPLPIPESNRTCTGEVFFFYKLLFGDIKLSDPERRNRKLSAHDFTDHIKTLFYFILFFCRCCGGIITGRFISLLIKKYQQDKKEDTCLQIASRIQFFISFSEH